MKPGKTDRADGAVAAEEDWAVGLSAVMDGEGSRADVDKVLYRLNAEREEDTAGANTRRQLRQYAALQQRMNAQMYRSGGAMGSSGAMGRRDISVQVMRRIAELPQMDTALPQFWHRLGGSFSLPDGFSLRALFAPFAGMAAGFALAAGVLTWVPSLDAETGLASAGGGESSPASQEILTSLEKAIVAGDALPADAQPVLPEAQDHPHIDTDAKETQAGYGSGSDKE